jgi:pSer/pThr/pTyr-binding forkhead associated (FHA) protein
MLLLMVVVGIAALGLLILRLRRRRQKGQPIQPERRQKQAARSVEPITPDQNGLIPFLEIIDARPGTIARIPIHGDNITIGRDETVAQVILNDSSISRLHARIRRRDDAYWLYDEGSTSGTSLNYERLGLAPRLLNDNDAIQIGRIALRFRLSALTKPEDKEEVIE